MRAALGYERDEQTVSEFIHANYYNGDMNTEEFIWTLIRKLSDVKDKDTIQAMYLGNFDIEHIVAVARSMN